VGFNLMCSEFTVVQYSPAAAPAPASWMNVSQNETAWIFSSTVDLRFYPTPQSAYDTLPPAVQKQIANLGPNAFSLQQLLFDLDNAALETPPTISGVTPGSPLHHCLSTYFLGYYFAAMKKKGTPLLAYTITLGAPDTSSLSLTNINFKVSPLVNSNGQQIPNQRRTRPI
jgi:hypothetical protein